MSCMQLEGVHTDTHTSLGIHTFNDKHGTCPKAGRIAGARPVRLSYLSRANSTYLWRVSEAERCEEGGETIG